LLPWHHATVKQQKNRIKMANLRKIKRREYSLGANGKKLPSVTEIMGRHLGWKTQGLCGYYYARGKAGEPMQAHRDAAGARGSCTHAIVAAGLGGDPVDQSEWRTSQIDEATPNAQRVVDDIKRRGWEVLYIEEALECSRFAGTVDLCVRDADGSVRICDLKTSRGIYAETVIQLGAYAWLHRLRGDHGIPVSGAVIHAPFGEPLRVVDVPAPALFAGEQAFRHLLDLHEIEHAVALGEVLS